MSNGAVELVTSSENETRDLGRSVGAILRGGERIGLTGELGAGKTCFVRGLAEGLGIDADRVHSPSFTLVLTYEGGRLPLYHIDLFRVRPGPIDCMALREYLYGEGVCAVEWYERLGEPLVDFLEIRLTYAGPRSRRLVAVAHGVGYDAALAVLKR